MTNCNSHTDFPGADFPGADFPGADFPGVFAAHHLALLTVEGEESYDYLNRMLSGDIPEHSNQWCYNAMLNHKGQIITIFHLIKLSETKFQMLIPKYLAPLAQNDLEKKKFRTKVSFRMEPLPEHSFLVPFDSVENTPLPSPNNQKVYSVSGGSYFNYGCGAGVLHIISDPSVYPYPILERANHPDVKSIDAWLAWHYFHCYPMFRETDTGKHLALRILIDSIRDQAISLTKGCYPGQEIVARTTYLGKQKYKISSTNKECDAVFMSAVYRGAIFAIKLDLRD